MSNKHPEHSDGHTERSLARIETALATLTQGMKVMAAELDRLKASEAALVSKIDEAVSLLHTLKAKIDELIAAGNDSADLAALTDQTDAALSKLSAEVAADTPTT